MRKLLFFTSLIRVSGHRYLCLSRMNETHLRTPVC